MVEIRTRRLLIRDPELSDLASWHRLMSDAKVMYYLPELMTHSLDESRANLERAIAQAQDPDRTRFFFAMEHAQTGAFIGSIGYTVEQSLPVGKLVGAGYFILPQYQGQGLTTEALCALIRFGFEQGNVFRMSTGCLAQNRGSERVMQKSGMIKEAELRQYAWHDGEMKDRVCYRLLRDEWNVTNNAAQ